MMNDQCLNRRANVFSLYLHSLVLQPGFQRLQGNQGFLRCKPFVVIVGFFGLLGFFGFLNFLTFSVTKPSCRRPGMLYCRRMQWDPHTLHLVIQRIRQQMRCPQCGEKVSVEFPAVRVTGEDFVLLQLKCDVCDAYIALHASLQGLTASVEADEQNVVKGMNISTSLCAKDVDIEQMRKHLEQSGGSFATLFVNEKKEVK